MNRGPTEISLLCLPPELILRCLQYLDDIESLRNVSRSHPKLYALFRSFEESLATAVLHNFFPSKLLGLAVTTFQLMSAAHSGDFFRTRETDLAHVQEYLYLIRDDVAKSRRARLSLRDVTQIELRQKFVEDLSYRITTHPDPTTEVYYMHTTSQGPHPMDADLLHTQRTIYWHELVSTFCHQLHSHFRYFQGADNKLSEKISDCVGNTLAPKLVYQIISLQGYFTCAFIALFQGHHGQHDCIAEAKARAMVGSGLESVHGLLIGSAYRSGDEVYATQDPQPRSTGYHLETVLLKRMPTIRPGVPWGRSFNGTCLYDSRSDRISTYWIEERLSRSSHSSYHRFWMRCLGSSSSDHEFSGIARFLRQRDQFWRLDQHEEVANGTRP